MYCLGQYVTRQIKFKVEILVFRPETILAKYFKSCNLNEEINLL